MSELASINLQRFDFTQSTDGSFQKMTFEDAQKRSVSVVFQTEVLRALVAHMIEYVTKLETEGALEEAPSSSDTEAQPLPATESALLYTKTLDLVRWDGGGAVLRAHTTSGVSIHLALTDAHQHYLLAAMSDPLS